MAWNRVQIDLGDESVDAMMSADQSQLEVANVIEVGDSIKVDKKTYKVVSSIIDVRDNFLTLNLQLEFHQRLVFPIWYWTGCLQIRFHKLKTLF